MKFEIGEWKEGYEKMGVAVKARDTTVRQIKLEIEQYQARIRELEGYIDRKEKSFEWIVEREIIKDIKFSEELRDKPTYKIFQMREVSQEKPSGQPESFSVNVTR